MATSYDDAVAQLYKAPHEAFVAERKRLSAELRAAGDKPAAARVAKLARPPLSAWAVNQLWWRAGGSFRRLFAAAARLRAGDQGGAAERREALAALEARAAAVLIDGGHAVSKATLRRVTTTLSALAASGSFEPDPAGALVADRAPPGFDAATMGAVAVPSSEAARPAMALGRAPEREEREREQLEHDDREHEEREHEEREHEGREHEKREREQLEREEAVARERGERERQERERSEHLLAEQRRLDAERAARCAERERLQASLPALRSDLDRRLREVERLRAEVARVQGLADQADAAIQVAESRLAELGGQDG